MASAAAARKSDRVSRFSAEQSNAIASVAQWLKDWSGPQVFRLFGFAGTGKTTIARHLAETCDGEVMFGAFTGKAALVMQSKGCSGARTIHSMIYKPVEDKETGGVRFILDRDSPVRDAALVVIDECSMVGEELGLDLLSFGTKVLVLGDPAQLRPVRGEGFFTAHKPDVMLSEIHRQAKENPIIRLSMQARNREPIYVGDYGDGCRVMQRERANKDIVLDADQLLVGMNRTRRAYNNRMRDLNGLKSRMPVVTDRLVCLRNNRENGLLNGGIWNVKEIRSDGEEHDMLIDPVDAGEYALPVRVRTHQAFFEDRAKELPDWALRAFDQFDFGYALTVHKAQGSQWNNVVLFDESGVFREEPWRWLYTGITRAAERLTVFL